jgi:hypothetical protein
VLALFVFFDMLSELESVQGNYTSLVAFFHVMLQAPTRIYEVLPIAVLISAIYVFSQLASQSEYTIFRVAGLNTRQALFSLFKLAVPLAHHVHLRRVHRPGGRTVRAEDQARGGRCHGVVGLPLGRVGQGPRSRHRARSRASSTCRA